MTRMTFPDGTVVIEDGDVTVWSRADGAATVVTPDELAVVYPDGSGLFRRGLDRMRRVERHEPFYLEAAGLVY